MKRRFLKVLFTLAIFLFITNASALSFNLSLTNIEDKGNNNTSGSITNIDLENKELDVLFKKAGDEISFELTIVNSGDRAGILKAIVPSGGNEKIEYTTNIPSDGVAINGNDYNKILVTAKLKDDAVDATSVSNLKFTYNYEEGSCPNGEKLTDDESKCLCPEGTERTEQGTCVIPKKKIECKDDEIYNEEKEICEQKIVPVIPENPKTLDNIVAISLLFITSGLGIYAALFTRLKTKKSKIAIGSIIGSVTLFFVLTVVFTSINNKDLLSYVNPVTKETDINIKINETVALEEGCALDDPACPRYLISSVWDNGNMKYIYTWSTNKDDLKELQGDNIHLPDVYMMKVNDMVSVCLVHGSKEYCVPQNFETSVIYDICDDLGGDIQAEGSGETFSCLNDDDPSTYEVTVSNTDDGNHAVSVRGTDGECSFSLEYVYGEDEEFYKMCQYENSQNVIY